MKGTKSEDHEANVPRFSSAKLANENLKACYS